MSTANTAEPHALMRVLARFNAITLAISWGVLLSVVVWVATVVLVIKGGPDPGPRLGLLSQYFPGYQVTFVGAFVGAFWSFVVVFALTLPAALLYYAGVLHEIETRHLRVPQGRLLDTVARISVPHCALAFGLLSGMSLFLATLWLVVQHRAGEPLGPHLGLLSQYLPGYGISVLGSIVGFVYLLVLGAGFFACVGFLYNFLVSRGGASAPEAS